MNSKFSFRTGSYFPNAFMFAAAIATVVAIPLLTQKPVVALILLFAAIVIATTHHRFDVDMARKQYIDCVWILGFRRGELKSFDQIEYLFIKPIRVSQTMQLRVASSTIDKEQFDAFIRFSEEHKVHLFTADSKSSVLKKLAPISKALNTIIVDHTQPVNTTL
jgi:hypothetical protein